MKVCAYCQQEFPKLSREHVIAASFLSKYYPTGIGYSNAISALSQNFPVIYDVCAKCNNGILSGLDDYFLKFYDSIDHNKPIYPHTHIRLKYDFHLLARWLLKSFFNSERKNAYQEIPSTMHLYRDYIMNRDIINDFHLLVELLADAVPDQKMPYLKLGNVRMQKWDNQITYFRYFLTGNIVFYLLPTEISDTKPMEDFLSSPSFQDKNGSLLAHELKPEIDSIRLKCSGRSVSFFLSLTIEGNMPASERYF